MTTMRTRLYGWTWRHYRRAPFDSRRGTFWWWLGCKIETTPARVQPSGNGLCAHSTVTGDSDVGWYCQDCGASFRDAFPTTPSGSKGATDE